MPNYPPALPSIDTTRCTGCGRCVAACPPHVLWLQSSGPNGMGSKSAVLHQVAGCTGCARCVLVCPFDVIDMQRVPASPVRNAVGRDAFDSE